MGRSEMPDRVAVVVQRRLRREVALTLPGASPGAVETSPKFCR